MKGSETRASHPLLPNQPGRSDRCHSKDYCAHAGERRRGRTSAHSSSRAIRLQRVQNDDVTMRDASRLLEKVNAEDQFTLRALIVCELSANSEGSSPDTLNHLRETMRSCDARGFSLTVCLFWTNAARRWALPLFEQFAPSTSESSLQAITVSRAQLHRCITIRCNLWQTR